MFTKFTSNTYITQLHWHCKFINQFNSVLFWFGKAEIVVRRPHC